MAKKLWDALLDLAVILLIVGSIGGLYLLELLLWG